MKILFVLLLSSASFIAGNLDQSFLSQLEKYADPVLVEKLKKTLATNYQELYEKKFVPKKLLLWQKTDAYLDEKCTQARNELIDALQLSQEELHTIMEAHKPKSVSEPIVVSRNNKTEFDAIIYKKLHEYALRFNAPLPEYLCTYKERTFLGRLLAYLFGLADSPQVTIQKKGDKFSHILTYESGYFKNRRHEFVDFLMAHELMHIKFNSVFPDIEWLKKKGCELTRDQIFKFGFYTELQADMYPASRSLEVATQYENMFGEELKRFLSFEAGDLDLIKRKAPNCFSQSLGNNHPEKGMPNNDMHPSDLFRYIKAIKIRKILEVEHSWFKTNQADERYGNQYYDRAFQQWAEAQDSIQKNRSRLAYWKKIQLNFLKAF